MTEPESPGLPWPLELDENEVRARLRWAREGGHPQYLWPDVAHAELAGALRRLESVTRDVLLGRRAVLEGASEAEVRALGVAGFTSGMGPFLGLWSEDGRIDAAGLSDRLFAVHLAHGRQRAVQLGRTLERASGALNSAGLTPLLIKSGHTSRVYFPEPGVRPSLDVDLVVPPSGFAEAESALEGAGFVRVGAQLRPRKSDWTVPGLGSLPRSLEMFHSASQYAVDLHASLARNFHGVRTVVPAPVEDAPTAPAPFVEQEVRVLTQPALLAHHALHASEVLNHLTLVRLVEMVLMVRRDVATGALDWVDLRAFLEEIGGLGFAYPAFAVADRLVPGAIDGAFLERAAASAPPLMKRILADVRPGDTQRFHVLSLRERFMWCASVGDVVRRLGHMLVPAPSGGSVRGLAATYLDRAYRLLRGRVDLDRAGS